MTNPFFEFLLMRPHQLGFLGFLNVMLLTACLPSEPQNPLLQGTGSYTYTPPAPLEQRPVQVHFYVPAQVNPQTPVLMVFHGNERNAIQYRNDLLSLATSQGVLLLVPEFSETYFPGNNSYHLGWMFADGENAALSPLLPSNTWTYGLPDAIFEDVRRKNFLSQTQYNAIGHSAGAQFLHRLLMYQTNHQIKRAVVSAAGWYNLPDTSLAFPHGLRFAPYQNPALVSLFNTPHILQVGLLDNNPNSSALRHDSLTDLQGLHRLARAQYYHRICSLFSLANNQSLAWSLQVVPNLDHSSGPAVQAAFGRLFP
jgi:hypothetical protein